MSVSYCKIIIPVCIAIPILICIYIVTFFEGEKSFVTLTVEGEVNLSGNVCPGIVTIVCSGVDLTFLRWRYNKNVNIVTYFTDSFVPSNSKIENIPAIVSAELLHKQNLPNSKANFTSKLIVNASELQTEGITSIVCGDPQTFKTIPTSVNVIQKSEPETPGGVAVSAVYESGLLMEVIVSWTQQVSSYNNKMLFLYMNLL